MSFRYTLILLAVAAVAIAAFGLAQRATPPQSSAPPVTPTPALVSLAPASVTEMDVKIANGKEAVFSKTDSTWKLTNPPDTGELDQAKIDNLASTLATLHGTRTVAQPGADLSQYGLNNPRVTVTLTAGSQKSTIMVGDPSVDGQTYYATTQGGAVDLVSAGLVATMNALVQNPPHVTPTPSVAATAAPSASSSSSA